MGTYLNPGNSGFEEVLNGDYIDKTGLIALKNQCINTPSKLVCISRPRRFGKSYAAKMLCAQRKMCSVHKSDVCGGNICFTELAAQQMA